MPQLNWNAAPELVGGKISVEQDKTYLFSFVQQKNEKTQQLILERNIQICEALQKF